MRRVLLNKPHVFPMDLLSARPIVGASVRKLTRRYSGPCMKVRRSSDNALADIYFADNTLDVAALRNFAGSGSAYVDTFYDQFGSANFVQATTSSQPRIVNAGVIETANKAPALNCQPGPYWMRTGVASVSMGGTTMTLVAVATAASGSYPRYANFIDNASLQDFNNTGSVVVATTNLVLSGASNNVATGSLTIAAGAQYLISYVADGALQTVYANNSASTSTAMTNTWGSTGSVGFVAQAKTGSPNPAGTQSECVAFRAAISASDRAILLRSAQLYYGL